jgi:hypothetical protein
MVASVLEARHTLSHKEIEVAHRYLMATRNAVVRAVSNLSSEQATFTAAPELWSIADVVEHLDAWEDLFVNHIRARLLAMPGTGPIGDSLTGDARVIGLERNPSTKVVEQGRESLADAPPTTRPTRRRPLDESLERFLANRDRTIRVLQSVPNLREYAIDHRGFGPLDGYQWLLFIAAHTERHLAQIESLKRDPCFPETELARTTDWPKAHPHHARRSESLVQG